MQPQFLLLRMQLLFTAAVCCLCTATAGVPGTSPFDAGYRKSAAWAAKFPWSKTVDAASVKGLIRDDNKIDSGIYVSTARKLSESGGGVLFFGSGTYQFPFDLVLYNKVVIRGEAPAVSTQGGKTVREWQTKFVFAKLVLPWMINSKIPELQGTAPSKVYFADSRTEFAGLVNLEINRAAILIGTNTAGGINENAPVDNVIVYGIRSNNAALADPTVPTAVQKQNRQGWQLWPDASRGNINIAFSKNCIVAECVVNDAVTDNMRQPDFVTDDGMRFDGSKAEYRFAYHPGIMVQYTGTAKPAAGAVQVSGNSVSTSAGFEPIVINNPAIKAVNCTANIISEEPNDVADGKKAFKETYNLLYKDIIPSEAKLYTNEYRDTLPYRLILPENYDPAKKYPLLVYLHDFWEKGSDNKRHLRQFIWQFLTPDNRKKYPCIVVAPQLPISEPKWKTDGLGSETWPLQCVSGIITDMTEKYNADASRVYVVGNSMGGSAAVNFTSHHVDQVAAIIATGVFYRVTKNLAAEIKDVPMWLIYGASDERIESQVRQTTRIELNAGGATSYKYTELAGMGHRSWNSVVEKIPGLLDWLFAQRLQKK